MTQYNSQSASNDIVTKNMMREVSKSKLLTSAEEKALFTKYATATASEKINIRNYIVTANLRFALDMAIHYNKIMSANMNDIMTEAKIGLLEAVDKFDLSKNVKFISFAVWRMRLHVSKYLEENDLIRVPTHKKWKLNKLRTSDPLTHTDEEKLFVHNMSAPTSLDAPQNSDEMDIYLKDIIEDESAHTGEAIWINKSISSELENVMDNVLTAEEKFIINSIYGLNSCGDGMTLKETHVHIGKSPERVRQIKKRVLTKLRNHTSIKELHDISHESFSE